MTIKARAVHRVVALHDGKTMTVRLSWPLRLLGIYRKVRRGKSKGERLPAVLDFNVAAIERVGYRRPGWLRAGRLVLVVPGHEDRWNLWGTPRAHRIRFGHGTVHRQMAMIVMGLQLVRPELVLGRARSVGRKISDAIVTVVEPRPGLLSRVWAWLFRWRARGHGSSGPALRERARRGGRVVRMSETTTGRRRRVPVQGGPGTAPDGARQTGGARSTRGKG